MSDRVLLPGELDPLYDYDYRRYRQGADEPNGEPPDHPAENNHSGHHSTWTTNGLLSNWMGTWHRHIDRSIGVNGYVAIWECSVPGHGYKRVVKKCVIDHVKLALVPLLCPECQERCMFSEYRVDSRGDWLLIDSKRLGIVRPILKVINETND